MQRNVQWFDQVYILAMLANLPLCTGYSPARWWKGLNVMLEKAPGNFNMRNSVLSYCLKWISTPITNGSDAPSCWMQNSLIYWHPNNMVAESRIQQSHSTLFLRHHLLPPATSSIVLKWCKKLLWSHCFTSCGIVFLQAWCFPAQHL